MSQLPRKKPMVRRVPIVFDPDLAEAFTDARTARDVARARFEAQPNDGDRADDLCAAEKVFEDVKAQLGEQLVVFEFRGIGRRRYDELVGDHRPTVDQRREARKGGSDIEWNPDTFPTAVVAASLATPKMTADEVAALWDDDDWNSAELLALFQGAVEANQRRILIDLDRD